MWTTAKSSHIHRGEVKIVAATLGISAPRLQGVGRKTYPGGLRSSAFSAIVNVTGTRIGLKQILSSQA